MKGVQLKIASNATLTHHIDQKFIIIDEDQDLPPTWSCIFEKCVDFDNRAIILRIYDTNQSI